LEYFSSKAEEKGVDRPELMNDELRHDIEISEALK